jgi:Bacterial extracellular solute-binding protein
MVSNAQMTDAIKLSSQFEAENPGIQLKFISLPENQARAKITVSTATGSDQFDVVMISNYETPQWAKNSWLTDLAPYIAKTPGYDANDFIPSLRDVLSHNGDMYSVPFYGESSFLMYRKDLFEQAGITVPTHPTWQQVAEWARRFDDPNGTMTGICLRGKPGWGEVLARVRACTGPSCARRRRWPRYRLLSRAGSPRTNWARCGAPLPPRKRRADRLGFSQVSPGVPVRHEICDPTEVAVAFPARLDAGRRRDTPPHDVDRVAADRSSRKGNRRPTDRTRGTAGAPYIRRPTPRRPRRRPIRQHPGLTSSSYIRCCSSSRSEYSKS